MIVNQAYLVIRYDEIYDVLQKTLSAPFDVWSSLNETVETTLFGQAFGVFTLAMHMDQDQLPALGTFEYTCCHVMTSVCIKNLSNV